MQQSFIPQNGNNMPIHSPLVPDPIIPYTCKDSRTVSILCELDTDIIKKYLSPTPFNFVSNTASIYVNDFTSSPELPYMDAGIIIEVEYRGLMGGYFLFEYEDNDASIATGRELWGYPKKYADISLHRDGDFVTGKVVKKGVTLIDINCILSPTTADFQRINIFPHLNIHTIPNPDRSGIFSQRIISRDNSEDCTLLSEELGRGSATLKSISTDPLEDFTPKNNIGATYTVTDFTAGPVNGWGKVLKTII